MTYYRAVPEDALPHIARVMVTEVLPAQGDERRKNAVKWITELSRTIRSWHAEFLKLMHRHPAFHGSTSASEYRTYFRTLAQYGRDLDERAGYVKVAICDPIDVVRANFVRDFEWLRVENSGAYCKLQSILDEAYHGELGVIEAAQDLLSQVMRGETYDNNYQLLLTTPGYIRWQVAHRDEKIRLISEYAERSADMVAQLKEIAKNARSDFLRGGDEFDPDEHALVGSGGIATKGLQDLQEELAMELNTTPQAENRLLYALMAFCFGVVAVGIIMLMAWHNPNPSPYQIRVFNTVLAVALGGVATVMSGLLKADLMLGKQLAVGATGAFAVFVLTFFFAPA